MFYRIIKYWRPTDALKKKSISTKVHPEDSEDSAFEAESVEDEKLQLSTPYTYDTENEIETQEPEKYQQDD